MNRRRWSVVAVLFLLAFITIVDRVCISAAKNNMATELKISDLSFGLVFGAFALGYAIFMAPSGWLSDTLGPRRFLTLIVCLWSVFTLATGLVRSLPLLIAIRFLFGGAEAGAFPAAARAIYAWLPIRQRGLALGLLNTGSRLGAAVGLAGASLSITQLGWRTSFLLLGAAGFAWAGSWYVWFRDNPRHAEERQPASAGNESGTDWRSLLSGNSLLILIQYFASNFTFFICFSWLLPYLRDHFGLSAAQAGFYASIPLYCGALATWTSGLTVDWIYRRASLAWSRRLPAIAGFSIAVVSLLAAAQAQTAQAFIACFALTTFGVDFTLSPSWTVCSDVAGPRTGTLSGAMNTMGSLGSFASSFCFPWLLGLTGNIKTYFVAAAMLNLMAIVCWSFIHAGSKQEGPSAQPFAQANS
jgi:MFS transporter, ACS family, glucarate transporter